METAQRRSLRLRSAAASAAAAGDAAITSPKRPAEDATEQSAKKGRVSNRPRKATAQVVAQSMVVQTLEAQTLVVQQAPLVFASVQHLQEALTHIGKADPVLAPLIQEHGCPEKLLPAAGMTCFEALAKSIIYQQLSGKAAATIYGRVVELCQEPLTPASILAASPEALRGCGVSERKAQYLRDLATQFAQAHWSDAVIRGLPDDQLVHTLTQVKGIGPWTVDMLCIFNLGRCDILPVGDLGVRKGMQALYGLPKLPSPEEMRQVAAKWQPYRSIGSYLMWRVPTPARTSSGPSTPKKSKSSKSAALAVGAVAVPSPASVSFLP